MSSWAWRCVGVGGQQGVDLGLHHLGHPAHRLVLGHRQIAVVAEVAVEPLQGQRQQRQRIGPFGGLGQQPLHQRGFDASAAARRRWRAGPGR